MRQQRPTKINPPNVSPGRLNRQPLRNIINMPTMGSYVGRQAPYQENAQMRKQPISNSFKPNLGILKNKPMMFAGSDSDILPANQVVTGQARSARNSLKPQKRQPEKSVEMDSCCSNHPEKSARFRVYSEESQLYYCEKCAILLASQGFKVDRLTNSNSSLLVALQLPQPIANSYSNNRFVQESENFMDEVNRFLGKSNEMRQFNNDERSKVQYYYRSLSEQIDEYEEELKTSIGIMMGQQRQEILKMAGECDQRFEEKLRKMDVAERELEIIVRDIQINLEIISSLDESEFNPIMRKYEQTLEDHREQLKRSEKVEYRRVELVQPKPQAVQKLIGIISQCGLQLRLLDKEHSSKKKASQVVTEAQPASDRRFFTFEKNLQRDPLSQQQERSKDDSRLRMSELKTSFDAVPLESYLHLPGEEEVMQESIVHDDFNSALH